VNPLAGLLLELEQSRFHRFVTPGGGLAKTKHKDDDRTCDQKPNDQTD
jgi:hypothetical protein